MDGEVVDATLTRSDNALVVSAGGVRLSVNGVDPSGSRVALDANGNLSLEGGESIVIEASGYDPGSDVQVWLRSNPVLLGVVVADPLGSVRGTYSIPAGVTAGDHRVILSGLTSDGEDSVVAVGLRIGSYGKESNVNRWIISLVIALGITLALVIPTTVRRRKRANV